MFPFSILHLEQINSTNSYLENLLSYSLLDEYFVVSTSNQKAGRGQGNNSWHSTANKNIQFSLLLKPSFLSASSQFQLNMILSIALVDFLLKILPAHNVKIKWPNDIYVDKNKIAGILIKLFIQKERIDNAIIGIGLNVNETSFPKEIINPVSMKQILGIDLAVNPLRDDLLLSIISTYKTLQKLPFEELKSRYISHLFRYREEHNYIYSGQSIKASIVDISDFGQLILQKLNGKSLICNMGEIKFVI